MCRKNLQAVFEWAQMFNSIDSWSRETVLFRELPAFRSRALSPSLWREAHQSSAELWSYRDRESFLFTAAKLLHTTPYTLRRQIARWNMKDSVVLPPNRKSPERPTMQLDT